jgi:hypothetical protein
VWNREYNNFETIITPPYDEDGDNTTMSDAEKSSIVKIWRNVAAHWSSWDVDVTTEDPGADNITK